MVPVKVAAVVADRHRQAGVDLRCGTGVTDLDHWNGTVTLTLSTARRSLATRWWSGSAPSRRPRLPRRPSLPSTTRVNVQTLRYYERRVLLDEPDRTLGGHRLYSTDTLTVLRVIKAAQRLGFQLDEVDNLLEMGHGGATLG
jgi:hypothetical protein